MHGLTPPQISGDRLSSPPKSQTTGSRTIHCGWWVVDQIRKKSSVHAWLHFLNITTDWLILVYHHNEHHQHHLLKHNMMQYNVMQ